MHRNRIFLVLVELLSWLVLIVLIFAGIVAAWSNPDVTDRRFFIEHWPWYLLAIGTSLLAFWAHEENKK